MERLSTVVVNYNCERYVATAIESALALDWDDVEVVVVDDGSTDGSRAVIESYSDRAKVCLTENATQRFAANGGYSMTIGDVVVFPNGDDVLPPDLPVRFAVVWTSTTTEAQCWMQRIDQVGRAIGTPFRSYRRLPTSADIRRWSSRTTAYPTPPGSGNAYARWYLDRIFPLEPSIGDFADSGCLAAGPFLGDVVCVPEVVVGHRQHGGNDGDLLKDDRRFTRKVAGLGPADALREGRAASRRARSTSGSCSAAVSCCSSASRPSASHRTSTPCPATVGHAWCWTRSARPSRSVPNASPRAW